MNGRLREFERESKLEIFGLGARREIWEAALEKYAELIVRECMNISKNWEDQLENANSLKESNAVGIVAYRIARQFGVEE